MTTFQADSRHDTFSEFRSEHFRCLARELSRKNQREQFPSRRTVTDRPSMLLGVSGRWKEGPK
jgi:hypothetical protein